MSTLRRMLMAALEDVVTAPVDPGLPILDTLKMYKQEKGYPFGFTEKRNVTEASYIQLFDTHASIASTENVMKFGALRNKTTGAYEWGEADEFVAKCTAKGWQMHLHAFLWFNDMPPFISKFENDPNAYQIYKNFAEDHIKTVLTRYKGKFKTCDVINEQVADNGSEVTSAWYKVLGDDMYEIAYDAAHKADPALLLGYNDWGLETGNMNRSNRVLAIKNRLSAKGIPIHFIGFQMHTFLGLDIDTARSRFKFWVDNGMKVMLTELDVKTKGAGRGPVKYGEIYTPEMAMESARTFVDILDAMEKGAGLENILGVIMWSTSDKPGENFENLRGLIHHLTLFDQYRQPKLSYYHVMDRLRRLPDNSEIFQDFELGDISTTNFIGSKTQGTRPATWRMISTDSAARARVNFQGLGMSQTQVNVFNHVVVEGSSADFKLESRAGFIYNNDARVLHLAFRMVDQNNMYSVQAYKNGSTDVWRLVKRKNGSDIALHTSNITPIWGDLLTVEAVGGRITYTVENITGVKQTATVNDTDFSTAKLVGFKFKGYFDADKYSRMKGLKYNPIK